MFIDVNGEGPGDKDNGTGNLIIYLLDKAQKFDESAIPDDWDYVTVNSLTEASDWLDNSSYGSGDLKIDNLVVRTHGIPDTYESSGGGAAIADQDGYALTAGRMDNPNDYKGNPKKYRKMTKALKNFGNHMADDGQALFYACDFGKDVKASQKLFNVLGGGNKTLYTNADHSSSGKSGNNGFQLKFNQGITSSKRMNQGWTVTNSSVGNVNSYRLIGNMQLSSSGNIKKINSLRILLPITDKK